MSNLLVTCVLRFFSFMIDAELHQCALIHWYSIFSDQPDSNNGMWVATSDYLGSALSMSIIHIYSIFHAAHCHRMLFLLLVFLVHFQPNFIYFPYVIVMTFWYIFGTDLTFF